MVSHDSFFEQKEMIMMVTGCGKDKCDFVWQGKKRDLDDCNAIKTERP